MPGMAVAGSRVGRYEVRRGGLSCGVPPISRGRALGGGVMGAGTNAKGKEAHGPAVPAQVYSTSS